MGISIQEIPTKESWASWSEIIIPVLSIRCPQCACCSSIAGTFVMVMEHDCMCLHIQCRCFKQAERKIDTGVINTTSGCWRKVIADWLCHALYLPAFGQLRPSDGELPPCSIPWIHQCRMHSFVFLSMIRIMATAFTHCLFNLLRCNTGTPADDGTTCKIECCEWERRLTDSCAGVLAKDNSVHILQLRLWDGKGHGWLPCPKP